MTTLKTYNYTVVCDDLPIRTTGFTTPVLFEDFERFVLEICDYWENSHDFPTYLSQTVPSLKDIPVLCVLMKNNLENLKKKKQPDNTLKYLLNNKCRLPLPEEIYDTFYENMNGNSHYESKYNHSGERQETEKNMVFLSLLIQYFSNNSPVKVEVIMSEEIYNCCQNCKIINNRKVQQKFLKCGGCKNTKVFYCGEECQRANWKQHKTVCEKVHKINI